MDSAFRTLAATALLATTAAAPPDRWHALNREILARAIEYRTVAGQGQVPALANSLAERFRAAGWTADDVHVLPYEGDPGDRTAALVVRWPSVGKPRSGPLLVMAHLDVVEAKSEDWSVDPFRPTEKDGYLYGRGVADNKQGVAAITTALLELRTAGFRPSRDIIVLFTGDEESAGRGAYLALSDWRRWVDPVLALNSDGGGGGFTSGGKPLGYMIQSAEKGYATYALTVRNRGGHSSKPRPDNAIYQLARALLRIEAHPFAPMLTETTRAYFEARQRAEPGPLGEAMRAWLRNPSDRAAADIIEADPAESGLTRTTCVPTLLAGGHAENALPQLARATLNCRIMPGIEPLLVEAELVQAIADPQVMVERTDHFASAPASPLRTDVLAAFGAAVQKRFPGMPVMPAMDTGGSDAVPFRAAGIPVYGADGSWYVVPDDLRQHGRDERLKLDAIDGELDHWVALVTRLAGR